MDEATADCLIKVQEQERTEPNPPMDEATANRLLQDADTTTETVTTPTVAKGA